MNLNTRLRALERAFGTLMLSVRCAACGYPNPNGATTVIVEHGEEPRCEVCGAWVDEHGRAAGRATTAGGLHLIVLVESGLEETPEPLG